jgi:hypothetical protein
MFTNSSSGNTWANTGDNAVVAGIELELRKKHIQKPDVDNLKKN